MSAQNYADLVAHEGHSLAIYRYYTENVAIECEDCHEVLLDYDNEVGKCEICEENLKENVEGKWCTSCKDDNKGSESR